MSTLAVIDYGMGNLHSISKALQKVADDGMRIIVTDNAAEIREADRIVFPGVGAIRDCMQALYTRNLVDVIFEASRNKPFLGICLGMQQLLDHSEENAGVAGLGRIPGRVLRFAEPLVDANNQVLKVPHMGWNQVYPTQPDHPLWAGIPAASWFYFVHSYYASPSNPDHCAATTDYPQAFASAIADGNLFAVQFHPEKSQSAGLRFLANFLRWQPDSDSQPCMKDSLTT